MAKRKTTSSAPQAVEEDKYSEWRVRDALDTLKRAGEIVADKKMLEKVKALAKDQADSLEQLAHKAAMLAKMGRISPKAMEKLTGKM